MLKIQNTLSRQLEEFKPIEEGKVRFYHCGPTVYWTQHIGNMRAVVLSDLIRRSFQYLGYDVDFIRNYTDFGHLTSDADEGEDKMEKGARRENKTPQEIADKYIAEFERDIGWLNVLPPSTKARATDYLQDMIVMVGKLLEKGYAYETPTAIYFDVSKFEKYTQLSGQKLDKTLEGAGFGSVQDENKRNPNDFVVWFFRTGSHRNALQYWNSPFSSPEVENGAGFPGWHLECSAMATTLLGNTLDIHMGGVEHIPIHHPNEIAQSEAVTGETFVNYWVHNEHLLVDGKKMAKSEGTSFTMSDIVDKGFDPLSLRYFFLQAHYRSKQNFTWKALEGAQKAYDRLISRMVELQNGFTTGQKVIIEVDQKYMNLFVEKIEDDFNIPQALAVMWDMLKDEKLPEKVRFVTTLDFDRVLGLDLDKKVQANSIKASLPEEAEELLKERKLARENKDWAKADELRDRLRTEFSITVKDTSDGQQIAAAN